MYQRQRGDGTELNVASMLDMAFQLLTFFILTFRPPPLEGQIKLHLPPLKTAINQQESGPVKPGKELAKLDPASINVLLVRLGSTSGHIDSIALGETHFASLTQLDVRLREIFRDGRNPFEQIVLESSGALHYGELLAAIDVCARQTFPDGRKLSKLSFVEAADY